MGRDDHRRTLRLLGVGLLVLALPLAWLAATHPANEFKATLGIDALECSGPYETHLLVASTLLVYGTGFIVSAAKWRSRWSLIVALCCLGICAAAGTNSYHALR